MKQHDTSCGNTLRLFDTDAYIREFEANVLSCTETAGGRYAVTLDRTAFFPEAGGQPPDTGVIADNANNAKINVLDVQEKDGEIYHITDKPITGTQVTGTIDFALRYERMRNHSGEHILSGAAHRLFSCTNVGFHLNDDTVTVDFDKQLSVEQLLQLEREVNDIIAKNLKITAHYPLPEELAKLEYRSKLDLTENVRIVDIGEGSELCDRCACCAPHVASTAEVGMLIITDSINYKGGTRLNMVCGKNAYKISRVALSNAREIAAALSVKVPEASQAVSRLMQQIGEEKAKSAAATNAYIELKLSTLARTDGNIVFFEPYLEKNSLRRLVDKAADLCGGMCAGFSGSDESGWTYIIISRTIDLKAEAKLLNEKMDGRGGGSQQMIQGTARAPRKILEKTFI